jgi:hypothetical protein
VLDLDVFCDADFAGLWPYEDKMDPSCVKSRTGFVICLSNCPVIWVSKLQREIALSTMEAEYNALSVTMRSVLPFQALVNSVTKGVSMDNENLTSFKTTVWEDNAGAPRNIRTWSHNSSLQALRYQVSLVPIASQA